jgi:type I restriction enzyme, S subunit
MNTTPHVQTYVETPYVETPCMASLQLTQTQQPYTKYKPSGIAWLGDIPEHWEVRKLKYISQITTGSKDTIDQVTDGIYPFYVRSKSIKKINSFAYEGEPILTVGDGDICKIWHYVNGKFDFHQRVYKIFDFKDVNGKFLYYHLLENFQHDVLKLSAKSTVDSLRRPMFTNFYTCFPASITEQTAIAAFLDYKTAKIDRFIHKKKQLIKLLNEQKVAIINDAVTKGLDSSVKMKSSGIEWLGDIPVHWEVRKLKYVAKICNGSDCDKQTEGIYPVYGSGGIFGWNENYIYDKPSVLLGRKGTVDKPILVLEPFWTVDTAFYTKIKTEIVDVLFFYYLCCNIPFGFYSSKTALPSMTQTSLYEVKFCIPPLHEQTAIVAHIEAETAIINKTIATIEKEIALVQEYRTAIIAEAVTGKIDVREYCLHQDFSRLEDEQDLEEDSDNIEEETIINNNEDDI